MAAHAPGVPRCAEHRGPAGETGDASVEALVQEGNVAAGFPRIRSQRPGRAGDLTGRLFRTAFLRPCPGYVVQCWGSGARRGAERDSPSQAL
jgi:hypothetical protein